MNDPRSREGNGVRRVLVVEDDPDVREALADALADHGFEVACATDGREALRILRERAADVIVLDLMMPGMNGWQFRAEQKKDPALAHLPIVVVSASGHRDIDATAFLDKPFEVEALLALIARHAVH